MKTRNILVVSLAGNLVLAGWLVSARRTPERLVETVEIPVTNKVVRVQTRAVTGAVEVVEVPTAFRWSSVESDDYRAYIENLRAIGMPEQTIRDVIIADINKLYGQRMRALYPSGVDFKWWETDGRQRRDLERQLEGQRRDLEREKRELVKELLGVDLEDELAQWSGRPDDDERRYGFLSEEKQQQVAALRDKYRELERTLFENGGGRNPENRAKFAELRAQQEAEMAKLLAPQEYEEYQLRNSFTARRMRETLGTFEPTAEEFKQIFNMRKAFDDQYGFGGRWGGGDEEQVRAQRDLAEQQLDQQLRTTLGEQRYEQYQLAQDDRYRQLHEFAAQNNLPTDTAKTVYDMRKVAEEQRRLVLQDQTIPQPQRDEILAALAAETQRSVGQVMGTAYEEYQRRDGRWLQSLASAEQRDRGGRLGREARR